ncbi:hypothetical protein A1O1_06596 [Capronia coronata CBS 617.96]|uniref:Uncharacterized protein n=1 Tax=Capronia coronata CBS 617.96 TaxID=1182541 RepID=W9YAD4_9EURO|nr:uncharacterized protein A1O1_06596 [Capronia coronata CBS 617.96]EXJ86226.1 hypothetical protein A1O1_06596 [Capronia coronata CBS 617.96]
MTEATLRDGFHGSTTTGSSGGGTPGFLSKITRSPSRRHKPLGSNDSIDATLSGSAPTPPRPRPRPGYSRTTTAPAAPGTLNPIRADVVPRTNSDVSHLATGDTMPPHSVAILTNGVNTTRPLLQKHPSNGPASANSQVAGFAAGETDVPSASAPHGMLLSATGAHGSPSTTALYTHIQELANKRIATLDYLRKAHEGRTFWFNTVRFSESDIAKLPSYTPNRLARRAVNYMLLGMSIPTILDVHPQPHAQSTAATSAAVAQDYLRSLSTLLAEFESFQQLHPPDGSTASSLSRARIPQMFKRATATSRPRKSSGPVTDIGLPMLSQTSSPPTFSEAGHHASQPSIDTTTSGNTFASSTSTLVTPSPSAPLPSGSFPSTSAIPLPAPVDAPNSTLLPNEGPYTHLQTPPLPFTPDFFTVFATLCDVLIETYQRLLQILPSPAACTPIISDLFTKVDGRIRKVVVSAIIREFETASRDSAKKEMMGIQKVVLGGLMA